MSNRILTHYNNAYASEPRAVRRKADSVFAHAFNEALRGYASTNPHNDAASVALLYLLLLRVLRRRSP